jgi:uncharacterized protein (UPF0332 family)
VSSNIIINYWIEKANDDIASAEANFSGGRYQNTVRDCYFACFHIFTALLLKDKKKFKKHKEVRSILHRDYIRNEKIEKAMGKYYDWLFDNRQNADYRPLVIFYPDQIEDIIKKSNEFINKIQQLL